MPKAELEIKCETKKEVFLLRLAGDLTKVSGDELLKWHAWEAGLPEGAARLVIDFSQVPYINSAGIAALIRLVRIGKDGLYQAGCFGVNYHYEKLFKMVGLTRWLTIYPSEWTALE